MTQAPLPVQANDDQALDALIAVHQELAKQADTRRQRADAAGATLMTTAVALSAGLITVANALSDADTVPEWAVYVTFVSLIATLLLGGASRAGRLKRLSPTFRSIGSLWERERASLDALRIRTDAVLSGSAGTNSRDVKIEVLALWRARAEIGEVSVTLKNQLLFLGGLCLAVALSALGLIGFAVLGDVWK